MTRVNLLTIPALILLSACSSKEPTAAVAPAAAQPQIVGDESVASRLGKYAVVKLTTDLSKVSAADQKVLGHFIDAAARIDDIFWLQSYGEAQSLQGGTTDPQLKRLLEINYGPWDSIDADAPFVVGVGPKPTGAQFYPVDMTKAEFEAFADPKKTGLYSLVRRDSAGKLQLVPYSQAYAPLLKPIASELRSAAAIASDPQLKAYLELRATALETDDYQPSDFAWMAMKRNQVDIVIGPIETYEDQLYGYRAAFEAYVLVKDMQWSERLSRFAKLLPEMQRGLPVPAAYKREPAGADSDLNAYDLVYVAGRSNVGSKTIAINLPNDEEVGLKAGTRRLQLKNAIQAKFDTTLLPVANELIAKDQLPNVNPDAFFANVMFHEVAHGLGVKHTIDGKGTVRVALKEHYGTLEECKADILGLYLVTKLLERKELRDTTLLDHYVTYIAGIFRSVRWGATSAHSRANMIEFNYFEKHGAFTRDAATGTYRVNVEKMSQAVTSLAERLIRLQGDGDYLAVTKVLTEEAAIGKGLQVDLDRLTTKNIPVDIVVEQGRQVVGL